MSKFAAPFCFLALAAFNGAESVSIRGDGIDELRDGPNKKRFLHKVTGPYKGGEDLSNGIVESLWGLKVAAEKLVRDTNPVKKDFEFPNPFAHEKSPAAWWEKLQQFAPGAGQGAAAQGPRKAALPEGQAAPPAAAPAAVPAAVPAAMPMAPAAVPEAMPEAPWPSVQELIEDGPEAAPEAAPEAVPEAAPEAAWPSAPQGQSSVAQALIEAAPEAGPEAAGPFAAQSSVPLP